MIIAESIMSVFQLDFMENTITNLLRGVKNTMNKEEMYIFWRKRETQFFIDACRVLLVFLMIIAIIIMVKNIEQVKILGNDPCRVCMEKTSCSCSCTGFIDHDRNYSDINISWLGEIEEEKEKCQ